MGETHLNANCPHTEIELNAMAEKDAARQEAFAESRAVLLPRLALVATKAAAELRAHREARRQEALSRMEQP